jgi:hypothetical protein
VPQRSSTLTREIPVADHRDPARAGRWAGHDEVVAHGPGGLDVVVVPVEDRPAAVAAPVEQVALADEAPSQACSFEVVPGSTLPRSARNGRSCFCVGLPSMTQTVAYCAAFRPAASPSARHARYRRRAPPMWTPPWRSPAGLSPTCFAEPAPDAACLVEAGQRTGARQGTDACISSARSQLCSVWRVRLRGQG